MSLVKLQLAGAMKYRRKVLQGTIAERLKELLHEKASELGLEIQGLEVLPDHVHLFVAAAPTDAPQYLANQFKGYTSRVLRSEFPGLKSRLPSLWSRSYYVGSAGHVSASTIHKYIEQQKRS
jgi:REP-associated tyrosine transposase